MRIRRKSAVSKWTLLLSAFLCLSSHAGTSGTPDAEIHRLENELSAARNSRDAELLRPGAKPTDAKVKAKTAIVEEKTKALQNAFRARVTRPKTSPAHPERSRPESPTPSAQAEAPETALSGEGIKKEIHYPKKTPGISARRVPRLRPPVESVEEPVPATTATPNAEGLSEIRYPKKTASPEPYGD
jgi:hypothetical protein